MSKLTICFKEICLVLRNFDTSTRKKDIRGNKLKKE